MGVLALQLLGAAQPVDTRQAVVQQHQVKGCLVAVQALPGFFGARHGFHPQPGGPHLQRHGQGIPEQGVVVHQHQAKVVKCGHGWMPIEWPPA